MSTNGETATESPGPLDTSSSEILDSSSVEETRRVNDHDNAAGESANELSEPESAAADEGETAQDSMTDDNMNEMRNRSQKKMSKAAKLLGVETPPILEEVLGSYQLLRLFVRYMNRFQAAESVVFLKQVTVFARLARPHEELLREAIRIIWQYVVPESSFEVNISAPVREDLLRVLWNREAAEAVSNSLFEAAANEIRTLIIPHYNEWIKTAQWAGIKYAKFPPPAFNQVIQNDMLCQRLKIFIQQHFVKQQMKKSGEWSGSDCSPYSSPSLSPPSSSPPSSSDLSASTPSLTVYTTTVLYRCSKISVIDIDSGLVDCGRLIDFCNAVIHFKKEVFEKVRDLGLVEKKAEELWNANCDTLPFLKSEEHGSGFASFLLSSEDALQARFVSSAVYQDWLKKGEWMMVPECVKGLRQTRTADNKYLVDPTLAACLASAPLRQLLLDSTEGSQRKRELMYLIDTMALIHAAGKTIMADLNLQEECDIKTPSFERSSDLREEGRKFYKRFFEINLSSDFGSPSSTSAPSSVSMPIMPSMDGGSKQPLQMDNKLRSELHSAFFSLVSSRSATMIGALRKCGSYVYSRVSATWLKDWLANYAWVDKEYDNNSSAARAIQDLFDSSPLHDVKMNFVPFLEDIAANPVLKPAFFSVLPSPFKDLCTRMLMSRDFLHAATEDQTRSRALNLVDHFTQAMLPLLASSLPELDFILFALSKMLIDCEKCSTTVLDYPTMLVMVHMFQRVYPMWVNEPSWRSLEWTPAKSAYFNADNMNAFLLGNMSSLSCLRQFANVASEGRRRSGSDSGGSGSDSEALPSPSVKTPGEGKPEGKKTAIKQFFTWKKDNKRIRAMSMTRPIFREAAKPTSSASVSEAITSPSIRTLPMDDISSANKFAKPVAPQPVAPQPVVPHYNTPNSQAGQLPEPKKVGGHARRHSSTALLTTESDISTNSHTKKPKANPSPLIMTRDDDVPRALSPVNSLSPKLFSPDGSGRSTKSDGAALTKKKKKHRKICALDMFPVPTLEDTLESSYLRRQFTVYLDGSATNTTILGETELSLWRTFCSFFENLAHLSSFDLTASNSSNREAAQGILTKYRIILAPYIDELTNLLEDPKVFILPNLFKEVEIRIFCKKHEEYVLWLQSQLRTKSKPPSELPTPTEEKPPEENPPAKE